MALRPFAFGVRLRDKNRTLRVHGKAKGARGYVVEDARKAGKSRRREHDSLTDALRDAASTWRNRLN
jgi:hypothetical protein